MTIRVWMVAWAAMVMVHPVVAAEPVTADSVRSGSCDMAAASPWISRWFAAWDLVSREILHLPDAPAPGLAFFDSTCVYTTLAIAAPGATPHSGPALRGAPLEWRAAPHGDTLTLPNARRQPVALTSFADHDRRSGPYFVMAAPSYWAGAGRREPLLTAVYLHEFTHTRQIRGVARIIGPIDSTWRFEQELDDDAVQTRFAADSEYVRAFLAERDLFHRAASADSIAEARRLAAQGLAMMRARRTRWFFGDDAVFATLDDTFLSMEGAGQWAGYAWLVHPRGGGQTKADAVQAMLGRRRWWSQDEGLGIFLAVDRLLPGWPALVFREPSAGVIELLERATRPGDPASRSSAR